MTFLQIMKEKLNKLANPTLSHNLTMLHKMNIKVCIEYNSLIKLDNIDTVTISKGPLNKGQ